MENNNFYYEDLITYELKYNLEELGDLLDKKSKELDYENFSIFQKRRSERLIAPRKPNKPICTENNPLKIRVFEEVYKQAKKKHNKDLQEYEKKLLQQGILRQYDNNFTGYARYITDNYSVTTPFLNWRYKIPINEEYRQLHTYITGGTGSGKSEAIKVFLWHYLTRNTNTSLILLTPSSKIAEEVAKFWVNKDNNRLVYIKPNIDNKHYPCINPFDIPNKKYLSDIEAERYAEEFRLVFEELLKDEFSEQMNALLKNTLPVILKLENSSIYNLLEFLNPDTSKVQYYIDFANKHISNKNILDFLNGQFLTDKGYTRTKSSLHTRLHNLFSSTILQAVLVGKTTVNLEQLMNNKKLIIFDLSKGEIPLEWEIIGKLTIATIKIISFRRDSRRSEIVPCHLFIDECQDFITSSLQEILEQSRKYGLYLTLAQQQAGARMQPELFSSILGNTGLKLTGRNGDTNTLKILAKSTGANIEDLQRNLATGRFSLWRTALNNETQKPPIIISMPSNTIGDRQSMKVEEWKMLKDEQINNFYRKPIPYRGQNIETEGLNIDIDAYMN